jgi:hypothetical protein
MEVIGFVMLHNGEHLEEKWFELETLPELVIAWSLFSQHGGHDMWRKCKWSYGIFVCISTCVGVMGLTSISVSDIHGQSLVICNM